MVCLSIQKYHDCIIMKFKTDVNSINSFSIDFSVSIISEEKVYTAYMTLLNTATI